MQNEPKELDEAEFDTIGFNICKERIREVFEQLDRRELNVISYNAKVPPQLKVKVLTGIESEHNNFHHILNDRQPDLGLVGFTVLIIPWTNTKPKRDWRNYFFNV